MLGGLEAASQKSFKPEEPSRKKSTSYTLLGQPQLGISDEPLGSLMEAYLGVAEIP